MEERKLYIFTSFDFWKWDVNENHNLFAGLTKNTPPWFALVLNIDRNKYFQNNFYFPRSFSSRMTRLIQSYLTIILKKYKILLVSYNKAIKAFSEIEFYRDIINITYFQIHLCPFTVLIYSLRISSKSIKAHWSSCTQYESPHFERE